MTRILRPEVNQFNGIPARCSLPLILLQIRIQNSFGQMPGRLSMYQAGSFQTGSSCAPRRARLPGRGGEADSVDGELFECYFKQPLLDQFLIMEQIIDFDSRFSGTLNLIFVIRNQDCLLYSCGSYEE